MKKDILISYFLKNLNKIILKKINFSLVLVLMCISLNAQEIDYSNPILKEKSSSQLELLDSIYENAPYIFKGTVLKRHSDFHFKDKNTPYETFLIQIDEVYKGSEILKEGTIELIAKVRKIGFTTNGYRSGQIFIFACEKSDIQKKYYKPSNRTNLSLFYSAAFPHYNERIQTSQIGGYHIDKKKEINIYYFDGFDVFFKTSEEVDKFLKKRYKLKPSKPLPNHKLEKEKKKKTLKRKKIRKKNKKKLKAWQKKQKDLNSIAQKNLLRFKNNKSINTENDIELGFDNIETTEDENGSYLEFDITAKTNTTPFFLANILFEIRYESNNEYPFKTYITEGDSEDFDIIIGDNFSEETYTTF